MARRDRLYFVLLFWAVVSKATCRHVDPTHWNVSSFWKRTEMLSTLPQYLAYRVLGHLLELYFVHPALPYQSLQLLQLRFIAYEVHRPSMGIICQYCYPWNTLFAKADDADGGRGSALLQSLNLFLLSWMSLVSEYLIFPILNAININNALTTNTSSLTPFTLLIIHDHIFSNLPLLAHVPGRAVQGVGQPREHAGGSSGSWSAGEELSDLQGPRCQDSVPAAVARHRCQCPARDQDICKDPATSLWTKHPCHTQLYIHLNLYNNMVFRWLSTQLDALQIFKFLHFWIKGIFFVTNCI